MLSLVQQQLWFYSFIWLRSIRYITKKLYTFFPFYCQPDKLGDDNSSSRTESDSNNVSVVCWCMFEINASADVCHWMLYIVACYSMNVHKRCTSCTTSHLQCMCICFVVFVCLPFLFYCVAFMVFYSQVLYISCVFTAPTIQRCWIASIVKSRSLIWIRQIWHRYSIYAL